MNFIKKIFEGEIDEAVHEQFVRFGKGRYGNRFIISLWKTKKIKIKTSFEFANDLVDLCSDFGNSKVSGFVLSKTNLSDFMSENNIEGNSKSKRSGLYFQNDIDNQELTKEQIKKLSEVSYLMLLDLEGEGFSLKIKKKLPKPGKNEKKIDSKFCQLEIDEKFYSKVKDDLFWDVVDSKKININHTMTINEIIPPKDEKDFAKIRELAKRKGKIIRKITIDGNETETEKEFIV